MLQQASKRNAQPIREGRARLEGGSATALPFEEASFDKALSTNSLPFWPDQVAGVRAMRRVLRPGGVIAIILQPRWARTESEVKQIGTGLLALLSQVGFQQARLEFKPMKPIASVCALGIKCVRLLPQDFDRAKNTLTYKKFAPFLLLMQEGTLVAESETESACMVLIHSG